MTEASDGVDALERHFEELERLHMRGLPIVNPKLVVEARSPRRLGEHSVCALISPWFMNLVLLPGTKDWDDTEQGQNSEIAFPRETLDFTVCRDDVVGTYLSAVLFRTVSDFPNQETARNIADETVRQLFAKPNARSENAATRRPAVISRRALLTGSGAD